MKKVNRCEGFACYAHLSTEGKCRVSTAPGNWSKLCKRYFSSPHAPRLELGWVTGQSIAYSQWNDPRGVSVRRKSEERRR